MNKHVPVWLWATAAAAGVFLIGWGDWLTGYELNFLLFYFAPISICAWFLGFGASAALAVLSILVWLGVNFLTGYTPASHIIAVWNTMIRFFSFLTIGWSVSRIRHALDHEHSTAEDLRRALSEVKVLESFLPICAECKKIRDQQGVWQNLEDYIGHHSGTRFSHGYCPECAKKAMEEAGLIDRKTEQ
ncbi:MAG: hypothetical protein PHC90_08100 [Syntrophorhabdaceae bacterium]|nr:hypothetical protein [Syntrophorhabdaceae bacterium]